MNHTVLGASGFIGSRLLSYLKQQGYDCLAPGRDDPDIFEADLGYVYYCIGLTADFQQRPFDTIRAHVCHLNEILEKGRFDRLVYLSSTRLYDSGGRKIAHETDDLVLNPHVPRHLYDLSKAMGESICLTAGNGRAHIARLSCVYGDDMSTDGFLPSVLRRAVAERSFEVATSLDSERDYIHLDDTIRLLVDIVTKGTQPIYNVAGGVNVPNRLIFKAIEKAAGCRITATLDDKPAISPQISIERVKHEFGFEPTAVIDNIERILKSLDASNEAH